MIPKTIHYCWLSDDPIPQDMQNYMKTWKAKLPDFEFVLWNLEKFDINTSTWVKQAFENKKYAFAADYIRLFAVFNYGGFYMDMDIEVLRSMDDLTDNPLVLAYEDADSQGIEAGIFGAEIHNPIIKQCLDYYADRNFVKDDGSFDTIPLPKIMMQFCNKFDGIHDCYFFTCKSFITGKITTKPYSYAIHHFAGSWIPDFLIVGMGAVAQEKFLVLAKENGFRGIGFTCGGFVHQVANGETEYYPKWVDRWNLRFLYRFFKERHTRRRYLKATFVFPTRFIFERLFG